MSIPNNWCIRAGETIFFGGTAPINEEGTVVAPNDATGQTKQIIARYEQTLQSLGLSLGNLTSVTVYLKSLVVYGEMNQAYQETMAAPFPVRKVVQSPMTIDGMVVEMTAIASAVKKEVVK